jgi:uncharacterized protein
VFFYVLSQGGVVLPDQTQAIFFWQLAKANGDIDASYSLAISTYKGEGIEADQKAAKQELEELATHKNHANAKYSLAKIILDDEVNNSTSDESDDKKFALQKRALELYESAARGGVLRALNNVANMYGAGIGTSKDEVKARKWYEAAAEMGDPLAMFTLASWCNTGRGGEQDYEAGLKWNEMAAMSGMPRAQFNLAFHFLVGQGTEKVTAFVFFCLSSLTYLLQLLAPPLPRNKQIILLLLLIIKLFLGCTQGH